MTTARILRIVRHAFTATGLLLLLSASTCEFQGERYGSFGRFDIGIEDPGNRGADPTATESWRKVAPGVRERVYTGIFTSTQGSRQYQMQDPLTNQWLPAHKDANGNFVFGLPPPPPPTGSHRGLRGGRSGGGGGGGGGGHGGGGHG